MTWHLLRAKLPLVCMVVLSFVSLLLLLQIRPPDRLDLPRSTIRLGRNGWDPSIAQATAPLGVPKRPPSQPPAQRLVLWTAPPTPGKRRHYFPGWALNPSNADDALFLGAMINWWRLQKPMHSASTMTNTAPLRELNRSVLSPRHLCPQVLPVPRKQTQHWISTPWISSIRQVSGPDTGSLHCLFVIHQTTVCATRVGFGNASRRLLSWKPARAVPGPKSGPRFFLPSRHNLCKARGVRVVGYLASGPTGAATLVLRQQVLNIAKLRGRHSIFLFGVIAASPCCTWCTGRLTEVRLSHRPFVLPAKYLLLPQAILLFPCQLTCVFTRWSRHAVLLISAPMGAGSGVTWPLWAPRTAAPLCPRITSSSAQTALLGACRPSARIFGSSPRSAPSGCRLLTENVYPHGLRGAAVQVLSHTPWSSRVASRAWDHGSELTPQIAHCLTQVAWLLCLTNAIFQRHLSCSVPFQLQALLGLTDGTPLTEHHLQEGSRPYPVSLHCPLHRLLRPPGPTRLWWLRLRLRIQPQPQPVRLPPMGRAHYRPDGTRRRTRGELEARAKKKAKREREAAEAAERAEDSAAAVAAPLEGAEPGPDPARREREEEEEEKIEVEIEVEEEEAIEELPVRRPLARLRPAPKWGAASDRVPARDRSRSPRRMAISSDRLFRLSKALTSLLRHRAAAEGLPLREDGFFEVGAITRTRAMRSHGASSAEVLYAVQHDAKRRYTLQYYNGIPWIRAAQGHSQAVRKDLVMRQLRQHELPPFVHHGTRSWCYKSILRDGLLAGGPSGSRTDIHLVEHFPESELFVESTTPRKFFVLWSPS